MTRAEEVDDLTIRSCRIIREIDRWEWRKIIALIPEDIKDRISRDPKWQCGFTEFKGGGFNWTLADDFKPGGPVARCNLAIAATRGEAFGGQKGGWRFYSDEFTIDLPDPTDAELAAAMQGSMRRVIASAIAGEADRRTA